MSSGRFRKRMGQSRHAYLHMGLPLGVFPAYVQRIHEILCKELELCFQPGEGPRHLEYLFVVGEGDLCVRLELPHFRKMARIQTALALSRAGMAELGNERSASWMFSVPIELAGRRPHELHGPTLRFVTHLRLRRELFVAGGRRAESAVIDAIATLIDASSAILQADIAVGWGWADFLVDGQTITADSRFYDFLRALRELQTTDGWPVFQKTVTVLGFACTEKGEIRQPEFQVERALCLVRSQAGYFDQALQALEGLVTDDPGGAARICALDGREDLSLLPGPSAAPDQFLAKLHRLAIEQAACSPAGAIERIQTHLVAVQPGKKGEFSASLHTVRFKERDRGRLERFQCQEDENATKLLVQLSTKLEELEAGRILDSRVVFGASTTLATLRRALADDLNHFDTRVAILSVLEGGRALLDKMVNFHEALQFRRFQDPKDLETHRDRWAIALDQAKHDLVEWCHLSERVLGERLAGSYDDFFGDSGSAIARRGGLQKAIFLSDAIMQEFVRLLPSELALNPQTCQHRYFATVFESVSRIGSTPGVGLVSLPIKFRFALPRATPNLLHEVAMLLFYQRFPSPLWSHGRDLRSGEKLRALFLEDRAKEVARIRDAAWTIREADFREFVKKQPLAPHTAEWYGAYRSKSSLDDLQLFSRFDLQPLDQLQLFEEVAESVADTLVCAYGFGGLPHFERFLRNIAVQFAERARESSTAHGSGPRKHYDALLFRLIVVWETLSSCESEPPVKTKDARLAQLTLLAEMVDQVFQSPRYTSKEPHLQPFASFPAPDDDVERRRILKPALSKISSATYHIYFEPFLEDLQSLIRDDARRRNIQAFYDSQRFRKLTGGLAKGRVVRLNSCEIVASYLELLEIETREWLAVETNTTEFDPQARHRAALARSAVLASFSAQGQAPQEAPP